MEQNIGGIETLFGAGGAQSVEEYAKSMGKSVSEVSDEFDSLMQAQSLALENANNAYATAGMSANEYMETITGFAAALKQSTSSEREAAEAGNQAVIDMSDNANKMGTSMEAIQNAYQGFAKQNYTMLDNLKLGYGGTKSEMERLLANASELSGIEYNIDSLKDVYSAIHVIQDELGITGTTAKEAATTIEGSANSMRAAWNNFLSGAGGTDELVSSVETYLNVVVKNLNEIIPRLAEALPQLMQDIGDMLPPLMEQIMPALIDGAVALIDGMVKALPGLLNTLLPALLTGVTTLLTSLVAQLPSVLTALVKVIPMIISTIMTALPQLLDAALQIILALANGIGESLPSLIPQIIDVVLQICETLIENLPLLIQAAIQIFLGIVEGLIQALPEIIAAIPMLIDSIVTALIDSLPLLIDAGVQLFLALIANLPTIIVELVKAVPQIINSLIRGFMDMSTEFSTTGRNLMVKLKDGLTGMLSNLISEASNIGKNIVDGIWNGISAGWTWLTDKVGELADGLFKSAKAALGINSPSKKFRWLAEMCVEGFDDGIDSLTNGVSFGNAVNASLSTVGMNTGTGFYAGNSYQPIFNFYDTQTSPDAIRRKFQNTMTFGLAGGIK